MARTKKPKVKTPKAPKKKKQTFKNNKRSKRYFNKISASPEQRTQNEEDLAPSSSFYVDTMPSLQNSSNKTTDQSGSKDSGVVVKQRNRRKRRRAKKSSLASPSLKQSTTPSKSAPPMANSTQVSAAAAATPANETTPPINARTPARSLLEHQATNARTPARRRAAGRNGSLAQRVAQKVREKWREYIDERAIKAHEARLHGVSSLMKKVVEKATILRLLGDKTQENDELPHNFEHDANLLQDLDLIILAATPAEYESYTKLLRQEYANLNDASYKQMRLKVLETLLMIPNIYTTPEYQKKYDELARNNLKWEINYLKTHN